MPFAEYVGWQEFYEVEPWGLAVQDAMFAQVSSTLAELKRDAKARSTAYHLSDFMLFPGPVEQNVEPEPTVEGKTAAQWKLIHAAQAIVARQNAGLAP